MGTNSKAILYSPLQYGQSAEPGIYVEQSGMLCSPEYYTLGAWKQI